MTTLILIAGGSGSGKTWLARGLMDRLGERAQMISQDDFYHDLADQAGVDAALDAAKVDFDHPDTLDFALMAKVLGELRKARAVEVPAYDFATHRRQVGRTAEPAEVIIVEGILVLGQPTIRELADLSIFVRASEDLRFARRLARDMHERGRSRADATRQMREQVFPAHDRFVEPSAAHADMVFTASELEADMDAAISSICERLDREGALYT